MKKVKAEFIGVGEIDSSGNLYKEKALRDMAVLHDNLEYDEKEKKLYIVTEIEDNSPIIEQFTNNVSIGFHFNPSNLSLHFDKAETCKDYFLSRRGEKL